MSNQFGILAFGSYPSSLLYYSKNLYIFKF
nr:MAG TPA: hypothetical protein [Caudoviricetes sp.]